MTGLVIIIWLFISIITMIKNTIIITLWAFKLSFFLFKTILLLIVHPIILKRRRVYILFSVVINWLHFYTIWLLCFSRSYIPHLILLISSGILLFKLWCFSNSGIFLLFGIIGTLSWKIPFLFNIFRWSFIIVYRRKVSH